MLDIEIFLKSKGVTDDKELNNHMIMIEGTSQSNPNFNYERDYKVNPVAPNGPCLMG